MTSCWDVGLVGGGTLGGLVADHGGYEVALVVAALAAGAALLAILGSRPIDTPSSGVSTVLA